MQWMGRTMAVAAACVVAGAPPAALGGTPSFGPSQSYDTQAQHNWDFALGLLDGDTDLDVIGAGDDGTLNAMRGAAGTAFAGLTKQALLDHTAGELGGVAVADVDGDGRNDALASLDSANGLFSVNRGLGTGAFTTPVGIASGTYRGGPFATADFNQDGDPDVAVLGTASATASTSSLVIMQGAAGVGFTRTQVLSAGFSRDLLVGKLNGDADPDLVYVVPATNQVRVHRGAAGSTFSAPVSYATGPSPRKVAIGSLNGDAHPDFAVAYRTGLQFFFGKADGTFTQQAFPDDYGSLMSVDIADFDGDGHNDILLGDSSPYETVVLSGAGTGAFTKVLETVGAWHDTEVADLDGDRAPDLLAGSYAVVTRRNTTPRADLAAKLTAPSTATTTVDTKYTLGTTNAGPTTASGVVLTLDLPPSFTYKSAPTGCTYTSVLRRVTCTIGSVASGATASRAIVVRPTATGQFSATARVTSSRGDFNRTNNARAALTTVS